MSYSYYQCANNPLIKRVETSDMFQSPFLPLQGTATHPFLYYNPPQHGFNQLLNSGNSMAYMHRRAHGGSNSTTSSPVSTISNEESLDTSTRYEQTYNTLPMCHNTFRSLNFPEVRRLPFKNNSQLCQRSVSQPALADQPIDLTKPKSTRGSHLANLLSRKRKDGFENKSCDQSNPLNLSKRLCTASSTRHHIDSKRQLDAVIDMHDAIDSPVELVQLYESTQTTLQISEYLNQVGISFYATSVLI